MLPSSLRLEGVDLLHADQDELPQRPAAVAIESFVDAVASIYIGVLAVAISFAVVEWDFSSFAATVASVAVVVINTEVSAPRQA